MEELKRTITREETYGFKADDGTVFHSKEECLKYEESAVHAAKAAAWHYLVDERYDEDLFNNDYESLIIFDCPDAKAYEVIRHWAEVDHKVWDAKHFTPDYIGKRVAFFSNYDEDIYFNTHFATKEALMALYTKIIDSMFADKETKAE